MVCGIPVVLVDFPLSVIWMSLGLGGLGRMVGNRADFGRISGGFRVGLKDTKRVVDSRKSLGDNGLGDFV